MKSFHTAFLAMSAVAEIAFGQEQTAIAPKELSQLKEQMQTQERQLQSQEMQLKTQHEEIEKLKALLGRMQGQTNPQLALGTTNLPATGNETVADIGAFTIPGLGSKADGSVGTLGGAQQAVPSGPQIPQPPEVTVQVVPNPQQFNPTQEVAGEEPRGPKVEIGPAKLRFGGYLGLTGIYRSTNSGNGTGTSFNSIPFETKGQGNISETRLTANSSRISLRADADFPDGKGLTRLSGYFEMDFNGYSSGTNDVTSSSAGFRLRHAFGEAEFGTSWLFGGGQAFTLMTPQKGQISMWPSDVEMSQAVRHELSRRNDLGPSPAGQGDVAAVQGF